MDRISSEAPCRWSFEKPIALALELHGKEIVGTVDGVVTLRAADDSDAPFENGGVGLVIAEGALSTDQVEVGPLPETAVTASSRVSSSTQATSPTAASSRSHSAR